MKNKEKGGLWGVSADTVFHLPIGESNRVEVRRILLNKEEHEFLLVVDGAPLTEEDQPDVNITFETLAEVLAYFADLSLAGFFGEEV